MATFLSHWNVLRNRWSSAAGCSTPTVRRPSPCATFPLFSKGSVVYAVQPATLTLPFQITRRHWRFVEEPLCRMVSRADERFRSCWPLSARSRTLPSRMETMLHAIVSNRSGRRSRNSLRLRSDRAVLPNCAMPRPMEAGTCRFMNCRRRRTAGSVRAHQSSRARGAGSGRPRTIPAKNASLRSPPPPTARSSPRR